MAPIIPIALGAFILIPLGIVALLYLIIPVFKGIFWLVRQAFRFVIGEVGDALRIVGAIITQVVLLPLVVVNVLIGRWSAAGHFGRAFKSEAKTTLACLYRMGIGHPARLLCLTALTDGIENRLPEVIAAAPTADTPGKRTTGQFEGYRIIGSLPGGGSGGKLYVAEPDAMKLAIFARAGQPDVRQVVIKTFSLKDGSSLPQIVRESRALEAAKRLGLVLEHELSNERFYYVTQYMPGESLGLVTQRLHAMSGGDGLGEAQLRTAMGYSADLLQTLDTYHRGGLWHKDVKPDNIIVDGRSAHLVDFGLVTPLRSGMTLTTHGTEYFRDPEMVRLALKGVKVHQVDGAKFDVYAAGAVLFSMIENSFPAHGGLSQITRRCPEALRWVVRRAMADYDKRYASAAAMRADLEAIRRSADVFAVRPIDLPSMRGAEVPGEAYAQDEAPFRRPVQPVAVGAGSDVPGDRGFGVTPATMAGGAAAIRQRPKLRVNKWWSGGYVVEDAAQGGAGSPVPPRTATGNYAGFDQPLVGNRVAWSPRNVAMSAREQVESARGRVKAARERAQARMNGRRKAANGDFNPVNAGVVFAAFLFVAVCAGLTGLVWVAREARSGAVAQVNDYGDESSSARPHVYVELPEAPQTPVPPGTVSVDNGTVKVGDMSLPSPRIVIDGKEVGVGANAAETASYDGKTVLVISDVVPSTAAINSAIERLRGLGFEIIGNVVGSTGDSDHQVELEAAAKGVRGLGRLDAADVSEHIGAWLADHDELSLLVWFSRTDPEKPAVQAYVFAPAAQADADAEDIAAARDEMRAAASAVAGRR